MIKGYTLKVESIIAGENWAAPLNAELTYGYTEIIDSLITLLDHYDEISMRPDIGPTVIYRKKKKIL